MAPAQAAGCRIAAQGPVWSGRRIVEGLITVRCTAYTLAACAVAMSACLAVYDSWVRALVAAVGAVAILLTAGFRPPTGVIPAAFCVAIPIEAWLWGSFTSSQSLAFVCELFVFNVIFAGYVDWSRVK